MIYEDLITLSKCPGPSGNWRDQARIIAEAALKEAEEECDESVASDITSALMQIHTVAASPVPNLNTLGIPSGFSF
jgi:hypothetical protein